MNECPVCGRDLMSFSVQPHDPRACQRAHAGTPLPQLVAYARTVSPTGLCRHCGMVHGPGACP